MAKQSEKTAEIPQPDPVKLPAPGVHPDIDPIIYRRWPALSNSGAKWLLNGYTPAHYKAWRDGNEADEGSDAKDRGTATHAAILTPAVFDATYIEGPDAARSTNKWKDWASQYEHRTDVCLMKPDAMADVRKIRAAVWAHPKARRILEAADMREVSMLTPGPAGMMYKTRQDIICTGLSVMADVKTTRDARPDRFAWSIADYGYHRQGGTYMNAAAHWRISIEHFYIIAVESKYAIVKVFRIPDVELARGWEDFQKAAAIVAECERTGIWPGYDDEVMDIYRPDRVIGRRIVEELEEV